MAHVRWLALAGSFALAVRAVDLDTGNQGSIKAAASDIAKGLLTFYTNTPGSSAPDYLIGTFPNPPYFWWESGAAWTAMLDYWAYTGDKQYEDAILTAINAQVGPAYDFIMPQQAFDEGNDDQAFWTFNALTALEYGFPALPCPAGTSGSNCPSSYLNIANNAFNEFVSRWHQDSGTCGGGLNWQYLSSNLGVHYKSTVATGSFFQIAARLARYTGNTTYADWAETSWDWMTAIGLIDSHYRVYDGTDDQTNCTQITNLQFTYNNAIVIYGAAVMYNITGSNVWAQRLTGLSSIALGAFFSPFPSATGIMYESACEIGGTCQTDSYSFKSYLARWMGKTAVIAPYVAEAYDAVLRPSAQGAARACSGGDSGNMCGFHWYTGGFDGNTGLGQQMGGLEIIQALLAANAGAPRTQGNAAQAPAAAPKSAQLSIPTQVTAPASTNPATQSMAQPPAVYSSVPANIVTAQATHAVSTERASPTIVNTTPTSYSPLPSSSSPEVISATEVSSISVVATEPIPGTPVTSSSLYMNLSIETAGMPGRTQDPSGLVLTSSQALTTGPMNTASTVRTSGTMVSPSSSSSTHNSSPKLANLQDSGLLGLFLSFCWLIV